jgi:hypothetical protein
MSYVLEGNRTASFWQEKKRKIRKEEKREKENQKRDEG